MKFYKFLLMTIAFSIVHLTSAQDTDTFFTLDPTFTPDAESIIFSMDSDLWKVPTSGGNAQRLTAMEGEETNPSVSPDGKWLAFSSTQFGNADVYIIPLKGGEITQLTFHQSDDKVSSWSWDSATIYFTSGRFNSFTTYSIHKNGGTPIRLFENYFNTVHNVVENPINDEIYFNESWESGRFAHRKRYKGDYNPDIKSYNTKTKAFKKYTTYRGKDFGATFDKNGTLYFKSDEANDEYNLYTFNNGVKKSLTNFKTSIMWPKVSANGEKVVFRKDYQIYVYDVTSGKTNKPIIRIFKNNTLNKDQSFKTKGKISYFDVSPDDKKLAFISRGRLFISDIKGKFIKEIKTDPIEAVQEVKWLKNNKTLLYSQSLKGYYNWYSINAEDNSNKKQITKNNKNNRQLTFNSDRTKGVYISGRNNIMILDLITFKTNTIVTDELWGFYNSNPYFSPDDKYVVYNAHRNFESDIFTYEIATKKTTNLTNTKVSESEPTWSPDGKFIYFSSDKLQPGYPMGTTNSKIYQMALDKYEAPFKLDKIEKLFEEKKKEESKSKKEKDKNKEEEKVVKPVVTINPNNTMERLKQISPSFGQQENITVITKDDKTYIYYISNHSEGKNKLWKTTLEPFEKNKTESVSDKGINGYQIVSSSKNNYILFDGAIATLDIDGNKLKEIETNFTFNKALVNEFDQMFYEAWAGMEENFYDENFHGQNWQKLRDHYAQYLPNVTSRNDLSLIFNDMLGELNTSHFGFNSHGDEQDVYYGTRSLATGILFNNTDPFIVDAIVKESPTDVKGKNIKKGDELVAVNGVKILKTENREKYFSVPSFINEITLTLKRKGVEHKVNIHTASTNTIKSLLYDEWQDFNQNYVDNKSNNKIAYVHMKNMSGGELTKFKENLVSNEADKKALIVDLRFNTGGNVHDGVLNFLQQKKYLNWKYREGKLTGQSNFNYGNKPIVLLINEQSLSDAEMTASGFKELGLGTIVGTETYRWIIFTTGKSLVDGSFYRLPSWGCYTLDGKNLESEGVSPDVYVAESFKDRLEGKQPQLDKAIEILLKELNK
ncbi:PD40 domain-containing protein [Aureibaculum sp. A20]|uniref:Tricorn protease homolog n=1 Tax=Aureibaculum flavum TaxID=2795986 RepID=A0ABS0WUL0_9FLAO|nr:S41 family peptidase [Aureibaculum flavum]MBJ2175645.1 PD40 domain-containing protein [Aureibaculum flavum]